MANPNGLSSGLLRQMSFRSFGESGPSRLGVGKGAAGLGKGKSGLKRHR
jgi:hypothetical protein